MLRVIISNKVVQIEYLQLTLSSVLKHLDFMCIDCVLLDFLYSSASDVDIVVTIMLLVVFTTSFLPFL